MGVRTGGDGRLVTRRAVPRFRRPPGGPRGRADTTTTWRGRRPRNSAGWSRLPCSTVPPGTGLWPVPRSCPAPVRQLSSVTSFGLGAVGVERRRAEALREAAAADRDALATKADVEGRICPTYRALGIQGAIVGGFIAIPASVRSRGCGEISRQVHVEPHDHARQGLRRHGLPLRCGSRPARGADHESIHAVAMKSPVRCS